VFPGQFDDPLARHAVVLQYLNPMLAKLGMQRRTEAAVFAARLAERKAGGLPPPTGGT